MAWLPGVVSWAQVVVERAWRAEVELSVPAVDFIATTRAIHVSEPWRDVCTGDCATPRVWILGPRRIGVGAHFWQHFDHHTIRCEPDRDGKIVEQGRTLNGRAHQMHATQHHVLIALEVSNSVDTPMPGFRHERFAGRLWTVRRFRGDDAELRAQDERFRREAMLDIAQARRPLPVDRIRMDDWDLVHEQLALWSEEAANGGDAARRELARFVGRVAAAHHEDRTFLVDCANICMAHGCAADVLPWLDAHLVDTRGNERLRVIRRMAVRAAAPERLPGLLEAEGVTQNGTQAAAMLMNAEPYEAAEAAWRANEALPAPRLRPGEGRLRRSTLLETLVALLNTSNSLKAVYVRVDTEGEVSGSPVALPPMLRVGWPQGDGARQMLLVPLTHDIADAPPILMGVEGVATISVGLGDEDGPTDTLSIRGRFDGGVFVLDAASRHYVWEAVARFVAEPLERLSRRVFPAPDYSFEASAEERTLFEERARADEGIACVSGRRGGASFECAVSSHRMSARRAMVEVVRPALEAGQSPRRWRRRATTAREP